MISRREAGKLLLAGCAGTLLQQQDAWAASDAIPQTAPNPITLHPNEVNILKANLAERSASMQGNKPQHWWIQNWNSADQFFRWAVEAPEADDYEASILVSGEPGVNIAIQGPRNHLTVTIPPGNDYWGNNWNKLDVPGGLSLPQGRTTITVHSPRPVGERTNNIINAYWGNNNYNGMALLSLELVRRKSKRDIEQRIQQFRSSTAWFADAQYGLMVQWGEWGYPRHGNKKPWPRQIDDFPVNQFADMVQETGAGYCVWSATWRSYYVAAPIKAIDAILPGRTSERDLIGDLAHALEKRNIKLVLYYHCGKGVDKEWEARNWSTTNLNVDGVDPLFHKNWMSVITEIGQRYGKMLTGWLIDEGWYPAPFEQRGKALKAGNPNRIVSINSWVAPRLTEFMDFNFGEEYTGLENCCGTLYPDGPPQGGTGIYLQGPQKGLQGHGCFLFDSATYGPEWGIWKPDTIIAPPRFSGEQIETMVRNAKERRFVLSFNLLMYEDGSVSPASLEGMRLVRRAARGSH